MNRDDGKITIGGRSYRLTWDAGAMLALETVYRRPDGAVSFEDIIWVHLNGGSVRAIRAVFWAILQHHHPDVTIARASQLIDEAGGLLAFLPLLTKAINAER